MDTKNQFASDYAADDGGQDTWASAEHAAAPLDPEAEQRDWGSAIDLVKEACEAIRLAEARAQSAQDYAKQLIAHHKEQIKAADARTNTAERRAEQAQQRAAEAEMWLARLHDAIVEGFTRR